MQDFIARHASKITGVLQGFDRLLFRGSLQRLCFPQGVASFLAGQGFLLKEFETFVRDFTGILRDVALASVMRLGRPTQYLESSAVRKEDVALSLLKEHPIDDGIVCLLSCVEPCMTWQVRRSRAEKTQELRRHLAKCLHHYIYLIDREFGWMHLRVQTWMPYTVQICINGREWLGRQMDRAGLPYRRADNCFLSIDGLEKAQALFDTMPALPWTRILDGFVGRLYSPLETIAEQANGRYYWTLPQCEFATDVMFRTPEDLAGLYPTLARYAISDLGSCDTLRFLQHRSPDTYKGEAVTEFKHRVEGICVRHRAGRNSVKMYDKQGSVLRIETTTNDPGQFKSRRRAQGDPQGPATLRPVRKGVVDIKQRVKISQRSNAAYLQAIATVDADTRIADVLATVTRPTKLGSQRLRALRPWSDPDLAFLRTVNNGDFITNGFRNRDLVAALFPASTSDPVAARKAAAKVTRLLRLFRAHGIIQRVAGTHRYTVTNAGRTIITAALTTLDASITKIRKCA